MECTQCGIEVVQTNYGMCDECLKCDKGQVGPCFDCSFYDDAVFECMYEDINDKNSKRIIKMKTQLIDSDDNNGGVIVLKRDDNQIDNACDWVRSCDNINCNACPAQNQKKKMNKKDAKKWWEDKLK